VAKKLVDLTPQIAKRAYEIDGVQLPLAKTVDLN
jgi:hypothetical protein